MRVSVMSCAVVMSAWQAFAPAPVSAEGAVAQIDAYAQTLSRMPKHSVFQTRPKLNAQEPKVLESVDLSGQFPPGAHPNQGSIGSCHAFGSVGTIEAAYYRRYGEHKNFAEQDLFARVCIESGRVCNGASIYTAVDGSAQCGLGEGGNEKQDLRYLLRHGVLEDDNESCASYDKFSEAYDLFRAPTKETFLKLHELGLNLPKEKKGQLKPLSDQCLLPSSDAAKRRKEIQREFKGFKIASKTFFSPVKAVIGLMFKGVLPTKVTQTLHDTFHDVSDETCKAYGQEQKRYILGQLNAGRPVVVGMFLTGLKAWNCDVVRPTDMPDSLDGHAFIVSGYQNIEGEVVFKTRNSWVKDGKPVNPDLPEKDLCRVISASTVLAPGEH